MDIANDISPITWRSGEPMFRLGRGIDHQVPSLGECNEARTSR
jgi:hypothetical protein